VRLEPWRHALREGVFAATRPDGSPFISDAALAALAAALAADDPRLVQDTTCRPKPTGGACGPLTRYPVAGACLIGYCAWQGDGLETVGEVEEFFDNLCLAADEQMGRSAVWTFLEFFDDTPRPEVLAALRVEVARERERRGAGLTVGCHLVHAKH
jgi:hypothetical protein